MEWPGIWSGVPKEGQQKVSPTLKGAFGGNQDGNCLCIPFWLIITDDPLLLDPKGGDGTRKEFFFLFFFFWWGGEYPVHTTEVSL